MQISRKSGGVIKKKKKKQNPGGRGLGSSHLKLLSTHTRVITEGAWGGRAVHERRQNC